MWLDFGTGARLNLGYGSLEVVGQRDQAYLNFRVDASHHLSHEEIVELRGRQNKEANRRVYETKVVQLSEAIPDLARWILTAARSSRRGLHRSNDTLII